MVREREQQIVKLIDINHVLSAQVRFLATRVFESYDMSMCVGRTKSEQIITTQDDGDDTKVKIDPDKLNKEVLKSIVTSLEGIFLSLFLSYFFSPSLGHASGSFDQRNGRNVIKKKPP